MSWNDGKWNWVIWVYYIDGLKYLFEQGASPLDIGIKCSHIYYGMGVQLIWARVMHAWQQRKKVVCIGAHG